jgi:hypothetical protein
MLTVNNSTMKFSGGIAICVFRKHSFIDTMTRGLNHLCLKSKPKIVTLIGYKWERIKAGINLD